MKISKILFSAMLMIIASSLMSLTTVKPPKVKVLWKHHDCSRTGGFCIDVTWHPSLAQLTQAEKNEGYGTFDYSLTSDGKLKIVFDGAEATVNDTFPVDDDITIPYEFAKEVGYSSIIIKRGVYSVDYTFDRATFGQVTLQCELIK